MDMKRKLREFFTMTRRAEEGFTLVELIVVIAIVAILGGVAVPAYSGYIEKADAAADAQLLADVNKAFAAACMVKGVDNYNAGANNPTIDENGKIGAITVAGVRDEEFKTAFESFFDNEGAFKQEDIALYYNKSIGGFAENKVITLTYAGTTITLSSEDLSSLRISSFLTAEGMSPEALMNKIGDIVDFAAAFGSGVYQELFTDEGYMKFMCSTLGVNPAEFDSLNAAYDFAMQDAILERTAKEAGVSTDDIMANPEAYLAQMMSAQNHVLANTAVLYSAHNATQNADEIMEILTSKNPKSSIIASLDKNYGNGLSQASVAYGMYVAYAHASGDAKKIENTNSGNYLAVMNDLNDEGFQAYLKTEQAQIDLDAYLSSMSVVNNNVGSNKDAVNNLLVNDFDDNEMVSVLEQALANK